MINEKLGLPDIVNDIIENNYNSIYNSIIKNQNSILKINIDDFRLINNKPVGLNTDIYLHFLFNEFNNYNAKLSLGDFIQNKFKKAEIFLNIPNSNKNINNIFKSLTHELTHLYEFYQNINKPESNIWKQGKKIYLFDKEFKKYNDDNNLIQELKFLFYYSFSSEINARISALNNYLSLNKKNNPKIDLKNLLINSSEWKLFTKLNEFDYIYYFYRLKEEYSDDYIINIFNIFINHFDINFELKVLDDILLLLKKLKLYFKKVANSYKKKMLKLLSCKIQEKLETKIYNYNEYINNSELIEDISEIYTPEYEDYEDYIKEKNIFKKREKNINFLIDPYYKDYFNI
jgi:hypothetical protein